MSIHSINLQKLKELYNQSKLKEVLQITEELPQQEDFEIYQEVQMFRSICLFELSRYEEGVLVMNKLLNRQKQEREGKKIKEMDIIVRILLLWQYYFIEQENLKKLNQLKNQLHEICQQYSQQFSDIKDYNHGVYLLGIGTYNFIEFYSETDNLQCVDYFIKSLDQVSEYEYQILNSIGWIYISKSKFKESLIWNKRLYEKCPSFPGITNNLAISYMNLGMYEESMECLLQAEKLCPDNIIILNNLAQICEDRKDFENATAYYKKSYQLNPSFPQTCYQYAVFLNENQFQKEALQILEKGFHDNPDCYTLYEELVMLLYEKEDYETCFQYLKRGLENNLDDPFYLNLAEYEKAISYLKKTMEILQNENQTKLKIRVLSCLGDCQFYLKQYEEALNSLFQAINYQASSYNFRFLFKNIALIIDDSSILDVQTKVKIIESYQGIYQSKLQYLISLIENQQVTICLKKKLDLYVKILNMIAYQKIIQPQLIYLNELTHWDMYID